MEQQDWSQPFQLGSNHVMKTKTMPEDLYPGDLEFLEVFSSVGEYDSDQALYKYNIKANDGSEAELYFSIINLDSTIIVRDSSKSQTVIFQCDFVKSIRIDRSEKIITFLIDYGKNSHHTAQIGLKDSATLKISLLRTSEL